MKINKEYEQEYNKFKENNQDFYINFSIDFAPNPGINPNGIW